MGNSVFDNSDYNSDDEAYIMTEHLPQRERCDIFNRSYCDVVEGVYCEAFEEGLCDFFEQGEV